MAQAQGPSAVVSQLKELWAAQSRGRKLLALAVALGIAGFILVTRLMNGSSEWAAVADGASPEDNQELLSVLEQRAMPVRLANGKVEVHTDKLEQARAIAAAAGLPRAGKGFELFDGSHLGQSSFTEQVNYRRALQGELARSITALAEVEGARVHLALGKRSVFKDRDEAATASVALHLHPGQKLAPEQVRGIRQLVAASVEGLRADAVVIVDNHGNLLDAAEQTASTKSEAIETSITGRVRSMLEHVVGAGKVWVVTTAVVDNREVSETSETYDHQNPVIRSESRTVEGLDATTLDAVGGIAGSRGNLPGATPSGGGGGSGSGGGTGNGRLQETKNYEISRTVRQIKNPDAQLAKLYLAVVVDTKTDAAGKAVPRSDKELAELTALARQAAGIDDARGDKIDLRSIAFIPDTEHAADAADVAPQPLLPVPLAVAVGAGAALLAMIALGIYALKRKKRRDTKPGKLMLPVPVSELERALDARGDDGASGELPAGLEPRALPGPGERGGVPRGTMSTRDRVLAAVRTDVERAAEVLTAWLSETPPAKGTKS